MPVKNLAASIGRSVGRRPLGWWVATRLAAFLLLALHEANAGVFGDVNYFYDSFEHLSAHGFGDTLNEYPLPMVLAAGGIWVVGRLLGGPTSYSLLVMVVGLTVDALYTRALLRRQAGEGHGGAVAWILAVPALGGITLVRFDLLVGVLVGVAVLLCAVRPLLATVLVSLATALKLWPVLLLPQFVLAGRRTWTALVAVAVVGLGSLVTITVLAGPERIFSPLEYQSDRGLQVESVFAAPLMVAFATGGHGWHVAFADSRSYEVSGSGDTLLLALSTLATVMLACGFAVLSLRLLRMRGRIGTEAIVWCALATTTGFTVTSKVLSPQYLIWLFPVAAAGLALLPTRTLRMWTGWLVGVAAATHVLYPWLYRGLVLQVSETPVAVLLLVARDAVLVWLFVVAARQAWRATSRQHDREAVAVGG
ncbi:MAG: DUF2029 domain-containing protein [Nocardioidaceae bacterium]|nr:DUF2029 domain-containing protein [Nocardioidaceae bacterium]